MNVAHEYRRRGVYTRYTPEYGCRRRGVYARHTPECGYRRRGVYTRCTPEYKRRTEWKGSAVLCWIAYTSRNCHEGWKRARGSQVFG